MEVNIIWGFLISSLIAAAGYKKRALTPGGFWGAVLIGTLIITFGGWLWFVLLLVFFVSSSILTRYRREEKNIAGQKFAKGGPRDFTQTMANGGLGAVLAVLSSIFASPLWFGAYVGAMATVNADTWATELGVLSRRLPRLITNGAQVPPGTSGGVTRVGFLAAVTASLLIGLTAFTGLLIKTAALHNHLWIAGAALLSGTLGALLDSLLGATGQVMYYCEKCREETEAPVHSCGRQALQIRGKNWLNNDGVNLISSVFGAGLGALLAVFWSG